MRDQPRGDQIQEQAQQGDAYYALQAACDSKCTSCMLLLLAARAEPAIETRDGWSFKKLAEGRLPDQQPDTELVRSLQIDFDEKGFKEELRTIGTERSHPLLASYKENFGDNLYEFLLDVPDVYLLHAAALLHRPQVICQLLVRVGFEQHVLNTAMLPSSPLAGITPLYLAYCSRIESNDRNVSLGLLLAAKADPFFVSEIDHNPWQLHDQARIDQSTEKVALFDRMQEHLCGTVSSAAKWLMYVTREGSTVAHLRLQVASLPASIAFEELSSEVVQQSKRTAQCNVAEDDTVLMELLKQLLFVATEHDDFAAAIRLLNAGVRPEGVTDHDGT